MPAHQAQALIEYLKANPEAAKQVQEQAKQILKTPGMASAFMNMQVTPNLPDAIAVKAQLGIAHLHACCSLACKEPWYPQSGVKNCLCAWVPHMELLT
jgi:hypothetical protein